MMDPEHILNYFEQHIFDKDYCIVLKKPRINGVDIDLFVSGKTTSVNSCHEYWIFYNYDTQVAPNDDVINIISKSRKYINSMYRTPRLFRFKVPNNIHIFYSTNSFSDKHPHDFHPVKDTILGGENNTAIFVDLQLHKAYAPGVVKSSEITFEKVNPHNRPIRLFCKLFEKYKTTRA